VNPTKNGVNSGAPEGCAYKMSVNICKFYYYYEKKVLTAMVNNSTNINIRITFFHNQLWRPISVVITSHITIISLSPVRSGWDRRDRDCMVVEFTTTYLFSTYPH
jgi:hypothetical protein